jgi:hypothetical protein
MCTFQQVLSGWLNQGGWDEQGMRQASGVGEIRNVSLQSLVETSQGKRSLWTQV